MIVPLAFLPVAAAPLGVRAQLVAAAEVAAAAAAVLTDEPEQGRVEFGGPEVLTGREIVAVWRARRHRPRVVVPKPLLGPVWRGFREGWTTTPEHAEGRQTWREYVAALDEDILKLMGFWSLIWGPSPSGSRRPASSSNCFAFAGS